MHLGGGGVGKGGGGGGSGGGGVSVIGERNGIAKVHISTLSYESQQNEL